MKDDAPRSAILVVLGSEKAGYVAPFPGETIVSSPFPNTAEMRSYLEEHSFIGVTLPGESRIAVIASAKIPKPTAKGSGLSVKLRFLYRVFFDQSQEIGKVSNMKLYPWMAAPEEPISPEEFQSEQFQEKISRLVDFATEKLPSERKDFLLLRKEILTPHNVGAFVDEVARDLNEFEKVAGVRDCLLRILRTLDVSGRLNAVLDGYRIASGDATPEMLMAERQANGAFTEVREADKYPPEVFAAIEAERYRITSNATSIEGDKSARYLDWLVSLPWKKAVPENRDLKTAREILDRSHYGLIRPKDKISDYLAVHSLNPGAKGKILCLSGPPGVGKTSLAKAIASALGRPFVKVNLGGVHDEAEIRGHRRTYIAALPGRIITGIRRAGVNNPVILLDEIDKVSGEGGEARRAVEAALLELLDPEENKAFLDHYIEFPFDLSHVFFIAAVNELDLPPSLRDRMTPVVIPGYSELEKVQIAKRHLIPAILKECGLDRYPVPKITDNGLVHLIRTYTREAGVRQLQRNLVTIHEKITRSIVEPSLELVRGDIGPDDIARYLGSPHETMYTQDLLRLGPGVGIIMYVSNGMGDIGTVEASFRERDEHRKDDYEITGNLATATLESVKLAVGRVREKFPKLLSLVEGKSYHFHAGDGGTLKDGPSGGVLIYATFISALTGVPIKSGLAITGENTLKRDAVDPVGGVVQKILGAQRHGLTEVVIPSTTMGQLDDMPADHRRNMDLVPSRLLGKTPDERLARLREISKAPKTRFTVYAVDTPEEALAIAFPDHFPFTQFMK